MAGVLFSSNVETYVNNDQMAGWANAGGAGLQAFATAGFSRSAVSGTMAYGRASAGDSAVYTAAGAIGNQAIRTDHKDLDSTTGAIFVGHLLRSTADSNTRYDTSVQSNGTALRINISSYASGGTSLATSGYVFTCVAADTVHFESQIIGNVIEARIWKNSETRPSAPTVTATNSGIATGFPGLINSSATNVVAFADNIVITDTTASAGVFDPAPTPVSFSGPVPTRNGVIGTATTFANAGFFAGNLTPFTYSSVGTALPAGVTLNTSTGVLSLAASGATAGTTSGIIIRATDTGSNIANTNAYSIVIAASNAAPTFPGNISNISGTAGSAITPVNVSGQFSDTDALAYTASPAGTAWPSGLVVNSSTGIISGTIASASTTNGLKVRATDTNASTVDSNAFNVVIAASVTLTFTPVCALKAAADGALAANVAIHAFVHDKTTGALVGTKTGLNSGSTAIPPAFTASFGVSGTQYDVKFVDDANALRRSLEIIAAV